MPPRSRGAPIRSQRWRQRSSLREQAAVYNQALARAAKRHPQIIAHAKTRARSYSECRKGGRSLADGAKLAPHPRQSWGLRSFVGFAQAAPSRQEASGQAGSALDCSRGCARCGLGSSRGRPALPNLILKGEKMKLEELEEKVRKQGWGKIPEGLYYKGAFWDWLRIKHPKVLKEYIAWFNKRIRQKEGE